MKVETIEAKDFLEEASVQASELRLTTSIKNEENSGKDKVEVCEKCVLKPGVSNVKIKIHESKDILEDVTVHINKLCLNEKSEESKTNLGVSEVQIHERGPVRANVCNSRFSNIQTPYDRQNSARLLLSGGTQITTPSHAYIQENYNQSNISLQNLCQEEDKECVINEEIFYQKIEELSYTIEGNENEQNSPYNEIPDEVLDWLDEIEMKKTSPVENSLGHSLQREDSSPPCQCVSVCQFPVTNTVNVKRFLNICPKPSQESNVQDLTCGTEKISSDIIKKKNAFVDKYHKKFLKYDREIGINGRDKFNRTILMVNISEGKEGFAVYLVNKIKNCFQRCQTTKLKGIESVESYINECDNCGQSALYYASLYNCPDVVNCLMSFGANPNITETNNGNSPLHVAASRGSRYVNVVKLLCSSVKTNVNLCNKNGEAALHAAVKSHGLFHKDDNKDIQETLDSHEIIKYLLHNRGKLTIQDKDGATPLHLAVKRCKCDLICILHSYASASEWKEAVSMGDKNGYTPLHVAAQLKVGEKYQESIIMALMSRDANPYLRDSQGKIPSELVSSARSSIIENLEHFWSHNCWQRK